MERKRTLTLTLTILLSVVATLSGCSLFSGSETPATQNTENRAESSDSKSENTKKNQGIQLTWEVPGEAVDGFVIRYGENKSSLSKEIKLTTSQLLEESDPEYGPVYRYVLKDVPAAGPMFFSIAAYKGDRISNFSEILEESRR
jgi:hypothetical protein